MNKISLVNFNDKNFLYFSNNQKLEKSYPNKIKTFKREIPKKKHIINDLI